MNDDTKNAKAFWEYFKNHQFEYYIIDNLDQSRKEELLDELLVQLQKYCNELVFEISENLYGKQELIISAGGEASIFDIVDTLVQSAPHLEKWNVIALKPAISGSFETNYEGIIIKTKDLFFAPLIPDDEEEASKIQIRFFLESYNNERDLDYMTAVWIIITSVLGERFCGENIDYIDIEGIPNPEMIDHNIKKGALFPLDKLKEYINSKK